MADRTVRTAEGSKRYGQRIGDVIDAGGQPQRVPPVSPERLKSLRALAENYASTGNKALAKSVMKTYRAALAAFAKGRTPGEVANALGKPDEPEQ